jgi:uncharacterized iron-regulated membrane protein
MVTRKSRIRRISDWLHLWLGLITGILVVIISLTGCLYVFERDLRDITEPYRFVTIENKPVLPPSVLRSIAEKKRGMMATGVQYGRPGEAAAVTYIKKPQGFTYVYLNPYTGDFIREKIRDRDFFRMALAGHFYLWLPPKIGQPVVSVTVLIFVFLLISGLIMWWPRKWDRATRKNNFGINWKAQFKRLNYDLHNVLGFYVLLLAFVIAVTGLVFGFKWFARSYHFVLTGSKTITVTKKPLSDTAYQLSSLLQNAEDSIWQQVMKEYAPVTGLLQISFPGKTADPVAVTYNPDKKTYYKRIFRYFDRYTAKELATSIPAPVTTGEKIYRMNYDIHVGAAFGITGKIIAFTASLICASLPVTGFLIWWGRRKRWGISNR